MTSWSSAAIAAGAGVVAIVAGTGYALGMRSGAQPERRGQGLLAKLQELQDSMDSLKRKLDEFSKKLQELQTKPKNPQGTQGFVRQLREWWYGVHKE